MPRTLKNGRVVPSEPDEVLLETQIYNDGTRHYFIRTHKNSVSLTEDQARFVERALFDDLPYTIEDDEDEHAPLTEEAHKEVDRLRGLLAEGGRRWTAAENPQTLDEFFDSVQEVLKERALSEPIKTTSELINKYAGIIANIVGNGTQGSYTYQGVLGCFLNEWLEMSPPEEGGDTQDEFMDSVDEVLKELGDDQLLELLEEKTRQALNLDDPAIIRALDAMREARGLE